MNWKEALDPIAESFPYPLVFATVSGAHLYGFPSQDSDYDLRASHVLALDAFLGLCEPNETEERAELHEGLELDLVSHDLRKFCRLLLRNNGYALEQLTSPLILRTSSAHQEMLSLVPDLVTSRHAHHYLGFARNQWKLFNREPRIKTLLYIYRVLLTGIHLMRSGEIEASLPTLLDIYPQPRIGDLIKAKVEGHESRSSNHRAWAVTSRRSKSFMDVWSSLKRNPSFGPNRGHAKNWKRS